MTRKIHTVLIVDDDRSFCQALSLHLNSKKMKTLTASTGSEGLTLCSRNRIDIVLLDQKLPDGEGVDFCTPILSYNNRTKIILTTAYPDLEDAVKAIKVGGFDYLSKPFEMEVLDLVIDESLKAAESEQTELIGANKKRSDEDDEPLLIGRRGGLAEVQHMVDLCAVNYAHVLITGETGTGKNLVAKAIHHKSLVKDHAMISTNCASLPDNLIEAELFGYEKGAFTGAGASTKGIFELADKGTLFLDEIGDLALHLQSKLLGVLDEKKIKKLGGQTVKKVNVRIIAATNAKLEKAVQQRQFRSDLYYRLCVLAIHIPPLRERKEDIPELCQYFIKKIAPFFNPEIADSEVEKLMNYDWPGNVRELRNIIERSIILHKGTILKPSEFLNRNLFVADAPPPPPTSSKKNIWR
ncbi:sigma-54 dependent transcriptional regulator [Desulfococcaceae bacterium HSG9]|nr:sigma-54 dependent transcriptional regulator [Desulfococcaceae bacterium HSG9]